MTVAKFRIQWHQLIYPVFFSRSDHKFVDDPEYGQLLGRSSDGTVPKYRYQND